MTETLRRTHPACDAYSYPRPADGMAAIAAADVQNDDILVNEHGHVTGKVYSAQASTYGMITIGAPSGSWSFDVTPDELLFIAVPQPRQFCTACLQTTSDYDSKVLEDGRVFHLHRNPQLCTVTVERRADYDNWFATP